MRAALLQAAGQPLLVVDDVEIDDPRQGQVRVRVSHCGVCHSDLSIADGAFPAPTPIVLGHEAAGVVDAVGPGVTGVAPGDRVVLTPVPPCGVCYGCVRGEPGTCVSILGMATSAHPDGRTGLSRKGETVYRGVNLAAFSEYVVLPANGAVKVAADAPLDILCVIGCAVQTGVGAVINTARVEEGATVLVLGLGGIGLSVVQGARIAGAETIVAVDPLEARLEQAGRLGATHVATPDGLKDVLRGVAPEGCDYAFDAVGNADTTALAMRWTRSAGTCVIVGLPPTGVRLDLDPAEFNRREKFLTGTMYGSEDPAVALPALLDHVRAGRLQLRELLGPVFPLERVNDAFAEALSGSPGRVLVKL